MNHSVVSHPFPLIIFYIAHIFSLYTSPFDWKRRISRTSAILASNMEASYASFTPRMSGLGCQMVWVARWFGLPDGLGLHPIPLKIPSEPSSFLLGAIYFEGGYQFLRSTHDILAVSSYLWSSDVKFNCFP